MNDRRSPPSPRAQRSTPGSRWALATVVLLAVSSACSGGDDRPSAATSSPQPAATTAPPATTAQPPAPESTATTTAPTTATDETTPTTDDTTDGTNAPAFDFSAVGPVVDDFVAERGLNGAGLVVVDREHGIVHEQYWGEFDADRVSFVASASKMLVAGVLLHLQDQGLLDVDAPVADVVEWGSAHPTITPAQLVSNSSGLVGLDPFFLPHSCQFLPQGTLHDCARTIFTTPDDDDRTIPPDTEFRYGGAQWQVAGAVAEAASGRTWAELVNEVYVEPCGVDSLGFNNHFTLFQPGGLVYPQDFDGDPGSMPPTDNPNMEGGAYVVASDYAELLLMHLRDGWCGDTRVLSSEALTTLQADRTGEVYDSPIAYGMGWWVDRSTGWLTDPGAYGAVPWLDLDAGIGAFLVIESDTQTGLALAGLLQPLIADALA